MKTDEITGRKHGKHDNDADNILNLEVNGNLCDKQPGHNDSCKGDNVFIKQSMINRISNKYGEDRKSVV